MKNRKHKDIFNYISFFIISFLVGLFLKYNQDIIIRFFESNLLKFKRVTNIFTKADFHLFVIISVLYFIVLWIGRVPSYDKIGKYDTYGKSIKEVTVNIFCDIVLSILFSTVSYIII